MARAWDSIRNAVFNRVGKAKKVVTLGNKAPGDAALGNVTQDNAARFNVPRDVILRLLRVVLCRDIVVLEIIAGRVQVEFLSRYRSYVAIY